MHVHSSPSLCGADRIAHAAGTLAVEGHLDDWLFAWGCRLTELSARWYLRPLRHQLKALTTECQRRAVEARSMRKMLDQITDDARERARHAPIRAQAELDAVLGRWRQ